MSVRSASLVELSVWAGSRLSGKKAVSIETLLQWAYAQELVHAARPEGIGPEVVNVFDAGMAEMRGDLMSDIQASKNYGFEAPSDAYVVDNAVRALSSIEMELPIESYGRALARGLVPEVETRFRVKLGSLVAIHALEKKRPDWIEQPVLEVQKGKAYNGKDERGRRAVTMIAVAFRGDMPWEVARARLLYTAWIDALMVLRVSLAGRLERFALTGEFPNRAPWPSGKA